jgi:hypothetical protein
MNEKAHNKSTLEYADLLRAKRLTQIRDKSGFKENITYNVDHVLDFTTYSRGSIITTWDKI